MKARQKVMAIFCILIIIFAGLISIFFLSFKTNYANQINSISKQTGVESALIFSIIKAESKFNKNAESSAGAVGLMQIKLTSANYIAELDGNEKLIKEDLFIPQNNIFYGTKYLAYLINKFKNIDVAICAYNAGETNVRQWLSNSQYSSDGITLQTIPFAETEKYLKKVNFNFSVYKKIVKSV